MSLGRIALMPRPRLLHLFLDPRIRQRDALRDRYLGAPAGRVDVACVLMIRPGLHSFDTRRMSSDCHKHP